MNDADVDSSGADGRLIRALDAAIECFGVGEGAAQWLVTPNAILGWEVPLAVARQSEVECQLVCDVLKVMRGLANRRG